MTEKRKNLYLCTGNPCRSQMAEAWTKHLKGDEIRAFVEGLPGALMDGTAKSDSCDRGPREGL